MFIIKNSYIYNLQKIKFKNVKLWVNYSLGTQQVKW